MSFWEKLKTIYLTDILESFAIAMAISISVYYIFLIPNIVEGASMEPTFHDKELLVTDRVIQWFGATDFGKNLNYDYKRSDIVIFHSGKIDLIKRVIGLPGETIRIEDGKVYINDEELIEEYLPDTTETYLPYRMDSTLAESESIEIPDGYYFLMGDNRNNSKDSRFKEVGLINRTQFKGRVLIKYWPISEFKFYGSN